MQIVTRKDSKLLGRSEVQVLFPEKAGALGRNDAIKEVAKSMNTEAGNVTLIKLLAGAGSRDLVGWFHVYNEESRRKDVSFDYLSVRLLSKEEKEALKAAKKKAAAAAAA